MKRVVILGSTGSIGRGAIQVIKRLAGYRIIGLAAYADQRRLIEQVKDVRPLFATLIQPPAAGRALPGVKLRRFYTGSQGIRDMIDEAQADILVAALASAVGIEAIIGAIRRRMRICLATKELLVTYGPVIMREVRQCSTTLTPIDSEHSAIYQCLESRPARQVARLYLTASGGPLLHCSTRRVTKEQVLAHPVWKMGHKITVDSATMMNKGLEVIEAHHLFGVPFPRIKVVVHPEALCHSFVQFVDGSLLGQFSTPDMRLPIQYALTAPDRFPSPVPQLDVTRMGSLQFLAPHPRKFPCLELAYAAGRTGRTMPAVLNGANEAAVRLFLDSRIPFHKIPRLVEAAMNKHRPETPTIESCRQAEDWARRFTYASR